MAKYLIGLSTQATCASIFEWIYLSLPENYHLAELEAKYNRKSAIEIIKKWDNSNGDITKKTAELPFYNYNIIA